MRKSAYWIISSNREPLRQDVIETLIDKPKLLERENAFMTENNAVSVFVNFFSMESKFV